MPHTLRMLAAVWGSRMEVSMDLQVDLVPTALCNNSHNRDVVFRLWMESAQFYRSRRMSCNSSSRGSGTASQCRY